MLQIVLQITDERRTEKPFKLARWRHTQNSGSEQVGVETLGRTGLTSYRFKRLIFLRRRTCRQKRGPKPACPQDIEESGL
jgi:hypothetical protein